MYGYSTLLAHFLNIPCVVIAAALIVEKASKCLDFILTIFILHFLVVFFDEGTGDFYWWVTHIILITITCLLAEGLCMKLETAEIKLTVDDLIN